jgi:hypothetical protein
MKSMPGRLFAVVLFLAFALAAPLAWWLIADQGASLVISNQPTLRDVPTELAPAPRKSPAPQKKLLQLATLPWKRNLGLFVPALVDLQRLPTWRDATSPDPVQLSSARLPWVSPQQSQTTSPTFVPTCGLPWHY